MIYLYIIMLELIKKCFVTTIFQHIVNNTPSYWKVTKFDFSHLEIYFTVNCEHYVTKVACVYNYINNVYLTYIFAPHMFLLTGYLHSVQCLNFVPGISSTKHAFGLRTKTMSGYQSNNSSGPIFCLFDRNHVAS